MQTGPETTIETGIETAPVLAVLGRGIVESDAGIVTADDDGLTRGDGCFEGCRVRRDGAGRVSVDKLDAHLARFARSAATLDIPFDEPAWRDLVATIAAVSEDVEASLKLVLTRAGTGFAWLVPVKNESLRQRRDGLRVITLPRGLPSDAFTDAPWLLGGVKTLSYAVNMAAHREAEARGADDVLWVSTDGVVLEAPTASVVWAVGRTLSTTPTGDTGILAGTTQDLLFERAAASGWDVRYTLGTVADLHVADAVWLVSSVRGPVDVVSLDGVARTRRPEIDAEIRTLVDFPVP